MNILQINTVCGTGSIGRITTDIHAILRSRGHQSTVAYGRNAAQNCDNAIRIGNRVDNYWHVAKTRIFDAHGFGSVSATKTFIKKAAELAPDVIHLHNIHGYYLHVGLLFEHLKQTSIPVVWTVHDCWPFTGHCPYFDFVGCERWKTECFDCPEKYKYPKSMIFDRSKQNYRQKKNLFNGKNNLTIVAPSKWLAGLVAQSFLAQYPVTVINNGIDLGMFQPRQSDFRSQYGLEKHFIVLGVASVWEERKGYKCLLELASHLGADEKLVLVGLSGEQMRELPPEIIGIRKTDNTQELAEIYSAADVFLNPTLEDNFPTTNLESLACGTPVITFESGGSPECLDEHCGIVVAQGDLSALENAMTQIKTRGKDFYSTACRQRAVQKYDKDSRFEEYLQLYEQLLAAEK